MKLFPDYNPPPFLLSPPPSPSPSFSSKEAKARAILRKNVISLWVEGRDGTIGGMQARSNRLRRKLSIYSAYVSASGGYDNKPIAAIKINRYLGNRSVNFYEANISGNDMLFKAAIIFQLVNNFWLKLRRAGGGYRLSTAINIVTISRGPRCPPRIANRSRTTETGLGGFFDVVARIQPPTTTPYYTAPRHHRHHNRTWVFKGEGSTRARARIDFHETNRCRRRARVNVSTVHGNPFPRCVVSCSRRGSPCRP